MQVLDKGFLELVDVFGDDLMVVNTARVSFAKTKSIFDESDEKLIKYLANHKHRSPFYHPRLQFRFRAPISVHRQVERHRIGVDMNSESTRYVEVSDDYYVPSEFRAQSKSNKQGSSGLIENQQAAESAYVRACSTAFNEYQLMLDLGVAKEQAREVLPLATFVSWIWTASLFAVAHFIELRDEEHAQWEVRQYAKAMRLLTEEKFPVSLKALLGASS